jgi:arginine repressor
MKRYRSMKIKEIIQHQIIETQEELAAALKREGIIASNRFKRYQRSHAY